MKVKHLKIAVCGQTTPGKRLICNGLLGKEIIQEGEWGGGGITPVVLTVMPMKFLTGT